MLLLTDRILTLLRTELSPVIQVGGEWRAIGHVQWTSGFSVQL
jgi:hypothetical protein